MGVRFARNIIEGLQVYRYFTGSATASAGAGRVFHHRRSCKSCSRNRTNLTGPASVYSLIHILHRRRQVRYQINSIFNLIIDTSQVFDHRRLHHWSKDRQGRVLQTAENFNKRRQFFFQRSQLVINT